MLMFLGVVAAAVLLIGLIAVLHRLQYQRKVEAVDRTIPLPPLDPQDKQRVLAITADVELSHMETAEDKRERWLDRMLAAAPETAKDWQAKARQHADDLDFTQALACCAVAFPQLGALRQAAQILRQQIRAAQRNGDALDSPLADLYRIAAWADLLHSRLPAYRPLTSAQLKKFDMRAWQDFAFDYSTLGSNQLGLLTVADRKLISTRWGNPTQHVHTRELHDMDLQSMLGMSSRSTGAS